MKKLILASFLGLALFSCNKQETIPQPTKSSTQKPLSNARQVVTGSRGYWDDNDVCSEANGTCYFIIVYPSFTFDGIIGVGNFDVTSDSIHQIEVHKNGNPQQALFLNYFSQTQLPNGDYQLYYY